MTPRRPRRPAAGATRRLLGHLRERWRTRYLFVGLALWLALYAGVHWGMTPTSVHPLHAISLLGASLATLLVLALFAVALLTEPPPELRRLRVLAVLLPSICVLLTIGTLHTLEKHGLVSDLGEHIVGGFILSFGTIPFSLYIFRTFARFRDELARRAHNLQALHRTSASVAREPSLPRLHELIASSAHGIVGAERSSLLMPAGAGSAEALVGFPQEPGGVGGEETALMREVAATGESARARVDGRSLLAVPVRRHGSPVGAIAVARGADLPFGEEDELLLDMFGVAAAAAIENADRLAEAQALAGIEERERIAHDLHDDLGQLLGFLTAKIQAAQELVTSGRADRAHDELAGLERATRMLSAQVRESILGLRSRLGSDRPLSLALEEYVADFGIQTGLRTTFDGSPGAGRSLDPTAQYHLLRIAQEALSNVRRHSGARTAHVRLAESDGALHLSVTDDGAGLEAGTNGRGFGLKTMAERARALGAEFSVLPGDGSGTRVAVRLALPG